MVSPQAFVSYTRAVPQVERQVREDLEWLAKEAMSRLSPDAVLLLGSFGRGEGWVVGDAGPRGARYVSDVEIALVRWTPPPAEARRALAREAEARMGTKVGLYFTPRLRLAAARTRIPKYRHDRPLLATYDFRHGSRLLAGKDLLARLPPCDPARIPASEGLRLLGNRCGEALTSGLDGAQRSKLLLSCGEAVLLAHARHRLRRHERAEALARLAHERPHLAALADDYARETAARDAPAPHAPPTLARCRDHARLALAELAPALRAPAPTPTAMLASADLRGASHTGFVRPLAAWNAYLRRRLSRRGLTVDAPKGVALEWAVYAGCVATLLGEDLAGAARVAPGAWTDAWTALLA